MKIIGGEFRGRLIDMPAVKDMRPTSDKVCEAIFNIISQKIAGASFLDLFAGSGAVGLEALSRGAADVTFVDIQKKCTASIEKSIASLSINKDTVNILKYDAIKAMEKLSDLKYRFDLIFLDPPYYGDWVKKCLINIERYDILKHSSLVICEHFKKDIVPESLGGFKLVRQKRYGDTVLSFYQQDRGNEAGSIPRDI